MILLEASTTETQWMVLIGALAPILIITVRDVILAHFASRKKND